MLLKSIAATMLFIISLSATSMAQDTITITGEKWSPYNRFVLDEQETGFMFEIIANILAAEGYSYVYTERPWSRAIEDTRSGKFDALIGAGKGDAPDFIFPSEPIGFTQNCFYTRQDSTWRFRDMESLEGIRLGILKSMTYGAVLDEYIKRHASDSHRISIISGEEYLARNFRKLEMGRIDVTVDDTIVAGDFLQRSAQTHKFRMAGLIGEGYGIYLAFSPLYAQTEKMKGIITRGVERLRKTGQLRTILQKYGARDWKE